MDFWKQVGSPDNKEGGSWSMGSRITSSYSEGGRAVHVGEGSDSGTESSQETCAGHAGPESTSQPP
jgi:hypothetical protein